MRRFLKGRYVAPAAVFGAVAVFGLLAFTPQSARAASDPSGSGQATASSTQQSAAATQAASQICKVAGKTSGVLTSEQGVHAPGAPAITYYNLPSSCIAPGQALFAANCASCHGDQAQGSARAPNLQGLGAGTVDFWVSTGRMPLAESGVQATRKPPRFDRQQTLEIAAYVQSLAPGGTKVPAVNLAGASVPQGNELFTLNCAACHTITGAGDALAEGAHAPSLHYATVQQIVEAIRSGPGNMPRFGPGNITDTQARDIAAYVHGVIQKPNSAGGFALGGVGPVGEGFVALLLGVGILMLVAFWIGDRA